MYATKYESSIQIYNNRPMSQIANMDNNIN